jgi:hypothetical protein
MVDNKQNKKKEKQLEAISEKIKKSRLSFSDIVIPLASLTILVLLGVFVFVPMINSAIKFQNEYQDIQEKEKILSKLETQLSDIDDDKMQADLLNAKKVIPKTLKVSSFIYYIDNLAYAKGLSSKEISAGDVKFSSNTEEKNGNYILGVSGPLSYTGSLSAILSFLDELYNASPYVMSVKNIKLKMSGSDWKADLDVTGYYVPTNIDNVDLYLPFSPYTNAENIVEIFSKKAAQLE